MGTLFRSAAQTELLRVLMLYPAPVGLRQAARLAGIYPRSAELVLNSIEKDGLVLCERRPGRSVYRMNRRHKDYALLFAVFDAAEGGLIRARSGGISERALRILPFISESLKMLKQARGAGCHVAGQTV